MARLVIGAPTLVRAGGREHHGRIAFIAAIADQATRTFRVEVEAPNAERTLVDGLTAEIHLPLGSAAAHRISPASISLADDGRLGVKIVSDNRVRFLPVQITSTDADAFWVQGLPQQAHIITIGHDFVVDGQLVRAVPETTTPAASR